MMATGAWMIGALFCLVATVVLIAAGFVALRWFLDHGHERTSDTVGIGPRARS